MGITAALAVGSVVSAGLGVAGAIQANRQASAQRQVAEQAARQAQFEAEERAKARARDVKRLRSRQLVGFLKSGVALEGTPLDVLEETERLGEEDVAAIRRGGQARAGQFRQQAELASAAGRSRLLSGLTGAFASGVGQFTTIRRLS